MKVLQEENIFTCCIKKIIGLYAGSQAQSKTMIRDKMYLEPPIYQ